MSCIYDEKYVKQWDKNTKENTFIGVNGSKSYGFLYSSSKKILTFNSRDFYEKAFMFHANGKMYKYSCSVKDSEELKPVPEKTIRGITIYSCGIMQRRESDGKVLLTVINQLDMKMAIPTFLKEQFLPSAVKTWYKDI